MARLDRSRVEMMVVRDFRAALSALLASGPGGAAAVRVRVMGEEDGTAPAGGAWARGGGRWVRLAAVEVEESGFESVGDGHAAGTVRVEAMTGMDPQSLDDGTDAVGPEAGEPGVSRYSAAGDAQRVANALARRSLVFNEETDAGGTGAGQGVHHVNLRTPVVREEPAEGSSAKARMFKITVEGTVMRSAGDSVAF
jgi:hypothetical protein